MADSDQRQEYWKANLKLTFTMLVIWFVSSYVLGILLVEQLNAIRIGGYKLGFWFAQQGSMYIFVAIIFVYAARMKALDRKFGVHD